jgi:hypothetical protein
MRPTEDLPEDPDLLRTLRADASHLLTYLSRLSLLLNAKIDLAERTHNHPQEVPALRAWLTDVENALMRGLVEYPIIASPIGRYLSSGFSDSMIMIINELTLLQEEARHLRQAPELISDQYVPFLHKYRGIARRYRDSLSPLRQLRERIFDKLNSSWGTRSVPGPPEVTADIRQNAAPASRGTNGSRRKRITAEEAERKVSEWFSINKKKSRRITVRLISKETGVAESSIHRTKVWASYMETRKKSAPSRSVRAKGFSEKDHEELAADELFADEEERLDFLDGQERLLNTLDSTARVEFEQSSLEHRIEVVRLFLDQNADQRSRGVLPD